jgi:hypothetical protein
MADPDETCPGTWIEVDVEVGYCDLGYECRNPTPEAHKHHVRAWTTDDDAGPPP